MNIPSDFPDLQRNQPRVIRWSGGTFVCGYWEWGMLMLLAFNSGWRPLGTLAPADWDERTNPDGTPARWFKDNYFSRFGQTVTRDDAQLIADALGSALPDIPEHDALAHKVLDQIEGPGIGRLRRLKPGAKVNLFEFFSGENRAKLVFFITLCQAGEFTIN